jgi:hypothetical protein
VIIKDKTAAKIILCRHITHASWLDPGSGVLAKFEMILGTSDHHEIPT